MQEVLKATWMWMMPARILKVEVALDLKEEMVEVENKGEVEIKGEVVIDNSECKFHKKNLAKNYMI